jgi:acid phosphatase type 7
VPQKPNRPGALLGLAACCLLVAASVSPATVNAQTSGTASRALASPSDDGTAPTATLVGAGDICVTPRIDDARATAKLIAAEPDAHVFTLGDNSNEIGTAAQYADCYGATWGRFLDRTSASAGNHDYYADGAVSYYEYFGKATGPSGTGY